jgi:hypothetical protein
MKTSKTILAGIFALAVGTANAQIYESKDAEGVTEFSDTPSTGAEVVDLPATNVVDPVQEPELPPAVDQESMSAAEGRVAGEAGGEAGGEESQPGYIYYGGDDEDDPRLQRREDAARVDNRPPHEVTGEAREDAAGEAAVMHPESTEQVMHPENAEGVMHPGEGGAAHSGGMRR